MFVDPTSQERKRTLLCQLLEYTTAVGRAAHLISICLQGNPAQEEQLKEEVNKSESEGELEADGRPKRFRPPTRNRVSIYQKMLAVREADRLIESGMKTGIEKKVMATFPDIFRGRTGMKSGMLGRWMVQSKEQCWDQIPWEKMSAEDRKMKELPDWVRQPLGLNKRMRFSAGKDIPQVVKSGLIKLVERVSCGGKDSELTCGTAATKQLKEEAEALLQKYNEAQSQVASEHNVDVPLCKAKVTTKWVNRLLKSSGILRRSPNTMGAYLEYDDQRMCQSRKAWKFVRWGDICAKRLFVFVVVCLF